MNRPPLHSDWVSEREQTQNVGNWRTNLLSRIGALNNAAKDWADYVGHGIREIQIRFEQPVNAQFSFETQKEAPNLTWAQINVWEPNTKRQGTRVIRFAPDSGVLMALVKVHTDTGFQFYLLFRQKYQFAGKAHFFEFPRGWVKSDVKNRGKDILERDFPGVVGNPMVSDIQESMLGATVWENNAEYSNKITHHLVVITLRKGVGIHQFKDMLIQERLKKEYPGKHGYSSEFLTITPSLISLPEAAEALNSHLSDDPNLHYFFGENYSIETWTRFLAIHGKQFPDLVPAQADTI